MKTDPLSLHFEKMLERAFEREADKLDISGTDSTLALGFFLTQLTSPLIWQTPQLVIVPTAKEAALLEKHIRFFDPEMAISVLPSFDVSPYSGLYPNARILSARVRWLHDAQNPSSRHVFMAPAEALMQRAMPVESLRKHTLRFKVNDDLPADFSKKLDQMGYQAVPLVEDEGTYAIRGGIFDIFSPAHAQPIRVELFGDTVESVRFFNSETQRSESQAQFFTVIPPREILYDDENRMRAAKAYRNSVVERPVDATEKDSILQAIAQAQIFPGLDFLLGDFYPEFTTPLEHFRHATVTAWHLNPLEISRETDIIFENLKREFSESAAHPIRPEVSDLYTSFEQATQENVIRQVNLSKIEIHDAPFAENVDETVKVPTLDLKFLSGGFEGNANALAENLNRVRAWRDEGFTVFIAANTMAQSQRLHALLDKHEMHSVIVSESDYTWGAWLDEQKQKQDRLQIIPRGISESLRLSDERIVFLRDEDFFGLKKRKREYKQSGTLEQRAHAMTFGDLKPGDSVVHVQHGIGVYEGLKVMQIQGIDSEFIQLSYKDGDRLYLPIYRIGQIQKYSGPGSEKILDKLGGIQWQKTKSKVRNHLRELAAELLALYAKRKEAHRPPFPEADEDFQKFEAFFPYDETDDQLRAVGDIVGDMTSDRPMDRLICGDVGFGKTEVAMRAAFKAIQGQKQVAVLAPTTVLTFQHLETFQKRFHNWPVQIRALNRFVSTAEARKVVTELKEGRVDILIGTHRLLSKDIAFKDLGLLIIDEEQKFGVTHKEKIRKLKAVVDTLTLSATPIPRTLNMSLTGIRDLSIINTPPVDRLPTRTFVCKYDEETVRKAIQSEVHRGGQVFFLHNRVQSIYSTADELRTLVPEARIKVGHGQMEEEELERTMVAFFNHEIDILVCTTIIESGIDNPRANTMFIDNAHTFGLSQLYQLRGRVGRSKERAYCYLLIPTNKRLEADAQERLKVIQENTALGSGIRIAQHDLELRGSGNILGAEQSGQIDAVGYEMYLELLEQAVAEARGEEVFDEIEPDINVRIPALIPDSYIGDLRIRLSYYKALTEIASPDDIDRIEEELHDQFGKPPDPVINLMGLMLIRHHCRELGVRDLSSGTKTVSLAFTDRTPMSPERVLKLVSMHNKKYSITPDNRLIVRMNNITWPNIYEELLFLKKE